jgi:hypothetical protein
VEVASDSRVEQQRRGGGMADGRHNYQVSKLNRKFSSHLGQRMIKPDLRKG